jgi:ribosomal protein S27AE
MELYKPNQVKRHCPVCSHDTFEEIRLIEGSKSRKRIEWHYSRVQGGFFGRIDASLDAFPLQSERCEQCGYVMLFAIHDNNKQQSSSETINIEIEESDSNS